MPFDHEGISQYTSAELRTILANGSAEVIDVRTLEEYAEGHIPGVPLKPMQEVMDWAPELAKGKPYVFVCRSGNRSQNVAKFLKSQGFADVANFSGGMLGWDGDTVSGT